MIIKRDKRPILPEIRLLASWLVGFFSRRKFMVPLLALVLVCLFVSSVLFVLAYSDGIYLTKVRDVAYGARNFMQYLTYLPRQCYGRLTARPDRVSIEMEPRDYQKLMSWRGDAIKLGFVKDDQKRYVRALVRVNGGAAIPARVRLKGEIACFHMDTPKWSMRVAVEGDEKILGMTRFSLQHPERRSYIRAYLYNKLLSLEGLMTLKFDLVHVAINGVDKGIYNLEEVPGPMTIRRSGFKEGVFIHFDEVPHMAENVPFPTGYEDAYYGAALATLGRNYILQNPELKKQYIRAMELMEGFRHGDLKAHDVFDVKSTAIWLAVGDMLGCWHGFSWGNMRFYYNPDLDRMQPIAWDAVDENNYADVLSGDRIERLFRLNDPYQDPEGAFLRDLFGDTELIEEYIRALDRVTDPSYLDRQVGLAKHDIDRYVRVLQYDYPQFTVEDDLNRIRANAEYIRRVYLYPHTTFHAYFENYKDGVLTLGLANRKPIPVKIIGAYCEGEGAEFLLIGKEDTLKGKPPSKPSIYQKFEFLVPDFIQWTPDKVDKLKVKYKTLGLSEERSESVLPWAGYSGPGKEKDKP